MGPRARRQAPRLPHQAITALLAVLLLAAWSTPACAQQLTPFQGRGRPPTGGIDVYMSAVVDHLVEIDDANYRFEVGGGRGGGGGCSRKACQSSLPLPRSQLASACPGSPGHRRCHKSAQLNVPWRGQAENARPMHGKRRRGWARAGHGCCADGRSHAPQGRCLFLARRAANRMLHASCSATSLTHQRHESGYIKTLARPFLCRWCCMCC